MPSIPAGRRFRCRRSRARCSRSFRPPTNERASNNYQILQNFDQHDQQGRRQGQPPDQPAAVGVRPLSAGATSTSSTTRTSRCLRAAPAMPKPTRATSSLRSASPTCPRRRRCSRCGSAGRTPKAGKNPAALGDDQRAGRLRHQRPAERSARRGWSADAAHHRILRPRSPGDESAMAVSDRVQPEGELHVVARVATRSRAGTSSSTFRPKCRT